MQPLPTLLNLASGIFTFLYCTHSSVEYYRFLLHTNILCILSNMTEMAEEQKFRCVIVIPRFSSGQKKDIVERAYYRNDAYYDFYLAYHKSQHPFCTCESGIFKRSFILNGYLSIQ